MELGNYRGLVCVLRYWDMQQTYQHLSWSVQSRLIDTGTCRVNQKWSSDQWGYPKVFLSLYKSAVLRFLFASSTQVEKFIVRHK